MTDRTDRKSLRDRPEYQAAKARCRPGEYKERLVNSSGSVTIESGYSTIDIFIQHWEESVEHTPDEARALAWELLYAADFAEDHDA